MALGINQITALAGQFLGLVAGGLLAAIDWRAVFWISVPFGVVGTIWSYRSLRETGTRTKARVDWAGNLTFALGAAFILAAMTYGIQPYGGHPTGWTNPMVLGGLIGGVVLLALFVLVETRVAQPMFNLALFKIRAFAAGQRGRVADRDRPRRPAVHADHLAAGHLAAVARLQLRRARRCGPASTCCR